MNIISKTTQGNSFTITYSEDNTEIIYEDCFGDTLIWHNTTLNQQLVMDMIKVITGIKLKKAV